MNEKTSIKKSKESRINLCLIRRNRTVKCRQLEMQRGSPTISSLQCVLELLINDLFWDFAADVCNFVSNLFIIVIKNMEQVTRK